jgi:hypothetical protein
MPRSFWDEDPRFLDKFDSTQRESLRDRFNASSFCPRIDYVFGVHIEGPGRSSYMLIINSTFEVNGVVRAIDRRRFDGSDETRGSCRRIHLV